jgi:RimJ/RimL family protein N-acetyltransferase
MELDGLDFRAWRDSVRVEAGKDKEVAEWLASIGIALTPPFVTLAMVEGGKVIAAALFNNYQDSNIDLSVVFARPVALTRGNLRALFSYPFKQLKVERVSVRTRANNMKVRQQIRRLGFAPEGKHPRFYGNEAAMSYGMTRSQCRWL